MAIITYRGDVTQSLARVRLNQILTASYTPHRLGANGCRKTMPPSVGCLLSGYVPSSACVELSAINKPQPSDDLRPKGHAYCTYKEYPILPVSPVVYSFLPNVDDCLFL